MREGCCANGEKEGKKDNKTMTGVTPGRDRDCFFLPIEAVFCTLIVK